MRTEQRDPLTGGLESEVALEHEVRLDEQDKVDRESLEQAACAVQAGSSKECWERHGNLIQELCMVKYSVRESCSETCTDVVGDCLEEEERKELVSMSQPGIFKGNPVPMLSRLIA